MIKRSSIQLGLGIAALAFAPGCGPGFDPPSEVKTLRVFGVQKDKPYANPGDQVKFTISWDDAKQASKRPTQIRWGTCTNPPSDLYAACFPQLVAEFTSMQPNEDTSDLDDDQTHVVTLPSDIITRHAPPDPGQPTYGILYEFFAVCAGTIIPDLSASSGGLPLACVDADNKKLGSDDFIVGYSAVYAFENPAGQTIGNRNPVVSSFRVQQHTFALKSTDPASPLCVGAECTSNDIAEPIDCDADENKSRCFPACPDDGGGGCPDIRLGPVVDPASAERDDVSAIFYGRNFTEQMWVNYYADGGKFVSDTRLLNDAQRGWSNEFGARYRAPKDPGTVTIWAVVHDNRGGTEWARLRLGIY